MKRTQTLVGNPVSNFAGHSRHLIALAAGVPFSKMMPPDSQDDFNAIEGTLALCEELWLLLLDREMVGDMISCLDTKDNHKSMLSRTMSVLGAVQPEVTYIEQAQARIHRLFMSHSGKKTKSPLEYRFLKYRNALSISDRLFHRD
jgi:hypothetical protein